MIIGIGVDTAEISRVRKAMERESFIKRVFSEEEMKQMDPKRTRGASDFAGKEAVVKVFGTGFGKIKANDISILRNEKGAPYIELYGAAAEMADQMKINTWHISITNTADLATAFVIGSREEVDLG